MEFDERESAAAVSSYVCDALENEKTQEQRIAYIHSLPDCLLLHILSFLNTCEAVKTSLISKRWKDLWKYVPCLELHNAYFQSNEAFETFVRSVLLFRKTKRLDTFHLVWRDCDEHRSSIIDTWLRQISEFKPRDLKVEADGVELAWFPSYLLSCSTLEKLCLYVNTSEELEICQKMVNLPFLKSLSLRGVDIHYGIMSGLISACPLLEILSLFDCSFELALFPSYLQSSPTLERLCLYVNTSEELEICPKMVNLPFLKSLSLREVDIHDGIMSGLISACPLLEKLSLFDCSFGLLEIASLVLKDLTISDTRAETLRICAPNLVYLSCRVPLCLVTFENMPHLDIAIIEAYDRDLVDGYDGREVEVLGSLANAREIEFVGDCTKKILEKELHTDHIFRNLKRLTFQDFKINKDLQPIASFLRLTPNIEELSLFSTKVCLFTKADKHPVLAYLWYERVWKRLFEPYLDVGEHFELCYKLVLLVRENSKIAEEATVTIDGIIV